MKCLDAHAQLNTDHRSEGMPESLPDRCDFGEWPDFSVLPNPYLKPNLGCGAATGCAPAQPDATRDVPGDPREDLNGGAAVSARTGRSNSDLSTTRRGVVYPSHCNHLRHMSVMWYGSRFAYASWQLLSVFGLTTSYFRRHNRVMATVHQEMTFNRKLSAGDLIAINGVRHRPPSDSAATRAPHERQAGAAR